jgi:hypothetical protein
MSFSTEPTLSSPTTVISEWFQSKYDNDDPKSPHLIRSCSGTLPVGYEPSDYDVVCGRGKGSYNRPGNKRFRSIVALHVNEYQTSKTKLDKSIILENLVELVQKQDNGNARFLKYENSPRSWCIMTNDEAKEKVSQNALFHTPLHSQSFSG